MTAVRPAPPAPVLPLPDRPPGTVLAAAALGLVLTARALWVAVALSRFGSTAADDAGNGLFDGLQRGFGQALVALGVLAGVLALGLALATAMAWTGRTRVPLLVLACVAAVLEGLSTSVSVVLPPGPQLVLTVAPIAVALCVTTVVLLALPSAVAHDAVHAAHRAARRGPPGVPAPHTPQHPAHHPAAPTPNGRPAP